MKSGYPVLTFIAGEGFPGLFVYVDGFMKIPAYCMNQKGNWGRLIQYQQRSRFNIRELSGGSLP